MPAALPRATTQNMATARRWLAEMVAYVMHSPTYKDSPPRFNRLPRALIGGGLMNSGMPAKIDSRQVTQALRTAGPLCISPCSGDQRFNEQKW